MKIVYLNVWGDELQDKLFDYIEGQVRDTDIFCFQEATGEMKRRCAGILSNYTEYSDQKYISEDDYFNITTFVRSDIQVQSSGTLMAKNMDRGLATYVEAMIDNKSVYICNVHGKARPNAKRDDAGRLGQSASLIDFFQDMNGPVVIGGDFNLLPDTQSIEMFTQSGYKDLIKQFEIDTTRNCLAWDRFPVKMYHSDYVFLSHKVQLEGFSVPKNEISDHLPLIVEIAV